MTIAQECPICGQTCMGLIRHVCEHHLTCRVPAMFPYVWCWCGVRVELYEFARHLEDCGGLQAHWLEYALNVKDRFYGLPF